MSFEYNDYKNMSFEYNDYNKLHKGDTFCSIYINELKQKRVFHFISIDTFFEGSDFDDFDLGQINYKTKVLLTERSYHNEYDRYAFYLNVKRNYAKYI